MTHGIFRGFFALVRLAGPGPCIFLAARNVAQKKASPTWTTPDTGKNGCSAIPNAVGALRPPGLLSRVIFATYRFIPITVSSMLSTVVMVFELAWKPRCVAIICTNSRDMSTFDCSML